MNFRVLVVAKRSALDRMRAAGRIGEVRAGAPRRAFERAHRAHVRSLERVLSVLAARGLAADLRSRGRPFTARDEDYDLILSVGGDGTFLAASYTARTAPILGVNSDPERTEGFFAPTPASGLARLLDEFLVERARPVLLSRLSLTLDGRPLPPPVLNEVLAASRFPARTSRYRIEAAGRRELHKDSGLLVATPLSAWAAAQARRPLPLEARAFLFVARELYTGRLTPGRALREGVVRAGGTLRVAATMTDGRIFVDGGLHEFDFPLGAVLSVRLHPFPLRILGFDPAERARLYRFPRGRQDGGSGFKGARGAILKKVQILNPKKGPNPQPRGRMTKDELGGALANPTCS